VGWRSRDVMRAVALVAGTYLALQLIWFAHALFLVAFMGILFAIAVSAGVDQLHGSGSARSWRGLIVLTFFAVLAAPRAGLRRRFAEQGASCGRNCPKPSTAWSNGRPAQQRLLGVILGGDSCRSSADGGGGCPSAHRHGRAHCTAGAPFERASPATRLGDERQQPLPLPVPDVNDRRHRRTDTESFSSASTSRRIRISTVAARCRCFLRGIESAARRYSTELRQCCANG
jgi:hypothetical protein